MTLPINKNCIWIKFFNQIFKFNVIVLNFEFLNEHNNSKELYDLSSDISEEENVYKLYPELVKELTNEIDNWKNNL